MGEKKDQSIANSESISKIENTFEHKENLIPSSEETIEDEKTQENILEVENINEEAIAIENSEIDTNAEIELTLEDVLIRNKNFKNTMLEFFCALLVSIVVSVALTWPAVANLDQILLGGGELGGWLWRHWWHFEEVRALEYEEVGFLGSIEALISLGRFPETGNILDILLLSYPLRLWVGFPADHNMKIVLILIGNGLCAYTLARSYTDSIFVAIAVSTIAIINPLVIQDINKIGLRQVLLWWLFLFPVFLAKAGRSGSYRDAFWVGVFFTLTAAFYWFYGLFAAMFGLVWLIAWIWKDKPPRRILFRFLTTAGATALFGCLLFLMPYFRVDEQSNQSEALPEVTFFLSYPSYDTIASAPQRPSNYRENVLSSLHRGIDSAWPADFILDPRHGVLALSTVVFVFGIFPAFFIKRARMWVVVWLIFYLGTLGPFLKIGAQKDTADVFMIGDYVIRMPYCWMFTYIPGMSRMFAPYRLSAMMIVASVVLSAISLNRIPTERRPYLSILFGFLVVIQPFYRFDLEDEYVEPEMWRIPIQASGMRIPNWYRELDNKSYEGIIELPLEQQQDLLCAYQSIHHQKVYRSWATTPAIPPWIRDSGGGRFGKRMRWLAKEPPKNDPMELFFRDLSRQPQDVDFSNFDFEGFSFLRESGDYRWLIVHERGYFLTDPNQGDVLYRDVVRRFSEILQIDYLEIIEQESFEWPGKTSQFPVGPAWIPWASQEVQRPVQDMPSSYFMAIFDLRDLDSKQMNKEESL